MIEIKKNPNGDTRTAPKGVTFEQFQEANDMHIEDVKEVMHALSRFVDMAGREHDFTKKSRERMFYRDFVVQSYQEVEKSEIWRLITIFSTGRSRILLK